jgi:hypothetical protein
MIRSRPDRAVIKDEWIEQAIRAPLREQVQADGRIRRWTQVSELEGRFLRVVLLPDGDTVHNAFFDRSFRP